MKLTPRLSAAILAGLLLSQISQAENPTRFDIGKQCMDVSNALHNFATSNRASLCTDGMEVASAYVEAAGNELYQAHNAKALRLVMNGERELKEISSVPLYCEQFVPKIMLFLERVTTIKIEIVHLA